MSRKHPKFTDHKGNLVSVQNQPALADFLDQLSSGGGVLQEDLTCSIDGGIGGVEDGAVFEAGTSLEDVLIALFAGAPDLGLTQFSLYDETDTLIGIGQSNVYAVGEEITIDQIRFFVSDSEGAIGSNTATLQFSTDGALTETGIPVSTSSNTYDTTANNTLGKTTSDLPFSFSYVYNTKIMSMSIPTDSGGTLNASATVYHAVPAFLLNLDETTLAQATLEVIIGSGAEGSLVNAAKVNTPLQKVSATGNYTGTWSNTQSTWSGNPNVRHYFMIPAIAGASPSSASLTYTVGGTPASGDFTALGLYNIDVTASGWNLIDDPGATSVPYRIFAWNNLSSITSTSSPIELL